jgi:hypothetical protein
MRSLSLIVTLVALTACAAPVPTVTSTATAPPVVIVTTPGAGRLDIQEHGSVIVPAAPANGPTVENPQFRLKLSVVDAYTGQAINADAIQVNEFIEYDVHFVEVAGLSGAISHTVAITATGYRYFELQMNPVIKRHKRFELEIPLEPLPDTGRRGFLLAENKEKSVSSVSIRVPLTMTSPLPTPTPEAPWWTWPCNTPPVQHPDGCPGFIPIEQPGRLLPPPCVRTAYTETVAEEGRVDYRLVIRVDHPEYSNVPSLPVHVLHLTTGGWIADRDAMQFWDVDCGKDEAPLTWVAWQVLDTGSLAPTLVYSPPLPSELVAFLSDLAGVTISNATPAPASSSYRLYLPLVWRQYVSIPNQRRNHK